jgi:hypothetical protein
MSLGNRRPLALVGLALFSIVVWPFPLHASTTPHPQSRSSSGGGSDGPAEHALADLSPAAASFLAGRTGNIGVAIGLVRQTDSYGWRSDARFPLASIAKLAIMATVLDNSSKQGQQLTVRQLTLLQAMLEWSDNDAASALWASLGGGVTVRNYVRSIGMKDFVPGAGSHWGDSVDSPADIARLLAALADGSILDESNSSLALVLMSRVERSQRWGVTAGAPSGALLAFKNGWAQMPDGTWELHSAGVIVPQRADNAYAIVILTQAQPSLEYGVQTIQAAAQLIHADLAASH